MNPQYRAKKSCKVLNIDGTYYIGFWSLERPFYFSHRYFSGRIAHKSSGIKNEHFEMYSNGYIWEDLKKKEK